ncbi:MAG: hypothetical protein HKN47_01835 [Pirellulaceae bacterium]|nr:hypothetical protein [Pirellulaceae bacterium]
MSHFGSETKTQRRRKPQVALSTILLVVAACAVWFSIYRNDQRFQSLSSQLRGLKAVSRELTVLDPNQFAAVKKIPTRFGECIMEVYVPRGAQYEICLALDDIDESGFVQPVSRAPISAGEQSIEIRYEKEPDESTVMVLRNGEVAMQQTRAKNWEPRVGSSGSSPIDACKQYHPDEPLTLFRKRFMVTNAKRRLNVPKGPAKGILVWIVKQSSSDD